MASGPFYLCALKVAAGLFMFISRQQASHSIGPVRKAKRRMARASWLDYGSLVAGGTCDANHAAYHWSVGRVWLDKLLPVQGCPLKRWRKARLIPLRGNSPQAKATSPVQTMARAYQVRRYGSGRMVRWFNDGPEASEGRGRRGNNNFINSTFRHSTRLRRWLNPTATVFSRTTCECLFCGCRAGRGS